MLFSDERFHLSPEKPKPGVAVHGVFPAFELAGADCSDDFLPSQPELLLRCFVAEGGSLAQPLGILIFHSSGRAPANAGL
jgi:hypothetical protein